MVLIIYLFLHTLISWWIQVRIPTSQRSHNFDDSSHQQAGQSPWCNPASMDEIWFRQAEAASLEF